MQMLAIHPPAVAFLRAFDTRPRLSKRGEVLIRAGAPASNLLLVTSGWACREHLLPNGNQVVLDLYLPGDLGGLANLVDGEAVDSIVALTAVGYYTLNLKTLELLLMYNPGIGLHITKKVVEERRRLDEVRLQIAGLNALGRTAAFLLHIYERLQKHGIKPSCDDQGNFVLPLTQQRLAEYLGLHPIHLNRTLRTLREQGIASIRCQEVQISSMSRLRQLASALVTRIAIAAIAGEMIVSQI
jgi:CRP-like cAMP-binding protein